MPLDSRTELIHVTRKDGFYVDASVELWQRWFLLLWRHGCSSPESAFGKPVLSVRVNLHKYKMELLLVWGPRLCNGSRSVCNSIVTTTSSCSLAVKTRCRIVSSSSLKKPVAAVMVRSSRYSFQNVREACEPCAVYVAGYLRSMTQALRDSGQCALWP